MNDSPPSRAAISAPAAASAPAPLSTQVQTTLRHYFQQLEGHPPSNLYKMVLREVEPPLLQTVLEHTRGNQTRAAEILGIDRSTLRKKLKTYGLE